jgi:hypothetical protein
MGTEGIEPGASRGKQEPSRLDPAPPAAPSLRRVRDVRKTLREIDQSCGELVNVSHLDPSLQEVRETAFCCFPGSESAKRELSSLSERLK